MAFTNDPGLFAAMDKPCLAASAPAATVPAPAAPVPAPAKPSAAAVAASLAAVNDIIASGEALAATRASGATAVAPMFAKPAPRLAPPYAPRPAIRPRDKLPVAKPVMPPTVIADASGVAPRNASDVPAVNGASAKPASMGSIFFRKLASGWPVSGLIVKVPPLRSASACNAWTSPGVIWTSIESPLRPLVAMWPASA